MKMSTEKTIPAGEEGVKLVSLKQLPDLKAIREARELTLNAIFLKTRINTAILEAIENGEYHLLPAPAYTKKFITIYAEAVGIDAENILAHYQHYVDEMQPVPEEAKVAKAQITFDRKPSKRYLFFTAAAVAIIAVVFIVYAFFSQKETPETIRHNVTVTEQKEGVPAPAAAVNEPPLPTGADVTLPPPTVAHEGTTQNPINTPLDLLVEATEDTWLNITEDGKPPYQITLKAGEKLSRTAREFFVIDVGNAAGANITFRGTSLGHLGKKGQVVHLRLPQQ